MRFSVALYLKRFEEAIEWSLKMLNALFMIYISDEYTSDIGISTGISIDMNRIGIDSSGSGDGGSSIDILKTKRNIEGIDEMTDVSNEVYSVICRKEGDLYAFALPLLLRLITEISIQSKEKDKKKSSNTGRERERSDNAVIIISKALLSRVRVSYADHCVKKYQVRR